MRTFDGYYYEDNEDYEDFDFVRSQALQRLLDDCRREERLHKHQRGTDKHHRHRESRDWEDDSDWDSYLDDSGAGFLDENSRHY